METSAVGTTTVEARTQTSRGLSDLRSEDFFEILVTELQQQDPFEPAETSDMIGQVSEIRSIELSQQLGDALTQLTSQQHTAAASELLGKFVVASVQADEGTEQDISGIVTGVRFDADGSAVLELDTGQTVRAESVTYVTSAENAESLSSSGDDENADGNEAAKQTATAKDAAKAKDNDGGLLSWLSLDGLF